MSELLSPAGSFKELKAAVSAGCDAVYLGGRNFNARQSAENFSDSDIIDAIKYCHLHKVKVYVTLNTVVSDRDIKSLIPFIRLLSANRCDGVIVQNLGLASVIKKVSPELELHGSTQLTVHSLKGVELLAKMGFKRVVLSRELSFENIKYICDNSPIEIEVFIHGALCMCYSGQCYLSSVIGARSGNRGSCAQPCRKEYKNGFELSLKDLSMASDFEKFLSLNITSYKIEGRLKSSDYVYGVTKTYRSLIDEKRNATFEETEFLKALFSRQGFTNGYFNDEKGKRMFGIRTSSDKNLSNTLNITFDEKKAPLELNFKILKNTPMEVVYSYNGTAGVAIGEIPEIAQKKGAEFDDVSARLSKLGDTDFEIAHIKGELDEGLFLPVSVLNNLRREALENLENNLRENPLSFFETLPENTDKPFEFSGFNVTLYDESNLSALENHLDYINIIWLPFNKIKENSYNKTGALLPAIITDKEVPFVRDILRKLKTLGITKTYCRTLDAVSLSFEEGLQPVGGFSLNIFNSHDLTNARNIGIEDAVISPECAFNIISDIKKPIKTSVIAYGRQPVMVTENCIIKNAVGCKDFTNFYNLVDKTGAKFPVFCDIFHRNIIFNSVPLNLSDKKDDFIKLNLSATDLIFTDESADAINKILNDFENSLPPAGEYTRGLYFRKV